MMSRPYTENAQEVLRLSQEEARRLNHKYIGTEHLLLGITKCGAGIALRILQEVGIDIGAVRRTVEMQVGFGSDPVTIPDIPLAPRVKTVLKLALGEAESLKHPWVDTEHILLGLLEEKEGIAARVLKKYGVLADAVRAGIRVKSI